MHHLPLCHPPAPLTSLSAMLPRLNRMTERMTSSVSRKVGNTAATARLHHDSDRTEASIRKVSNSA